ncbi:MAG TPA: bifunctional demethylmenaquinone methyltransferase/2-methoxy-6-polyprenyl-1,4-benzoquinol methylase UbiE [Ignavibacteriaceae bacterium]|nr:bifunctional demethylmenaquinone methyltransferase/2-methoxy-6-polyprenyl-1,4-benzoquinol methylase UbiE [Ignavibacteriaceae bacterium]
MTEKKIEVKKIFDSIAWRYDFLNHFLSFGMDIYWRKKALKLTGFSRESILLDVACGTGDVAIEAKRQGVKNIYGADYSYNMIKLFEKKSKWIKKRTIQMVAEMLPVKDESVTNITVAFGVRNFYDIQAGFDSFYRILKKDGKATIIEFRLPANPFFKGLYKFYFKKILPVVGGIISGDIKAYKYLPRSVEEFDEKINMPELLRNSGFRKIEIFPMTMGIVQTIIATK